jgi:hypothetical protein
VCRATCVWHMRPCLPNNPSFETLQGGQARGVHLCSHLIACPLPQSWTCPADDLRPTLWINGNSTVQQSGQLRVIPFYRVTHSTAQVQLWGTCMAVCMLAAAPCVSACTAMQLSGGCSLQLPHQARRLCATVLRAPPCTWTPMRACVPVCQGR